MQRDQNNQSVYNSEEDLLNDILKNNSVKHFKQIKFLATNHKNSLMKLRFVLSPFSFVFLLSGIDNYHLILETLDTEEATYIWHFERNIRTLAQNIKTVDKDLNMIRNNGRKCFLENKPKNFSRIVHDYSDERKGFVLWKSALEERLT